MRNRFNINESEKNRIRGLHNIKVINEQYTPEDSVTDNQCVGTATDKEVLDVYELLTKKWGYDCVGKIESKDGTLEMSEILLKKSIQGIVIYLYIRNAEWVSKGVAVSYYIPPTKPGDSVYFEGKEGDIDDGGKGGDIEDVEAIVWEIVEKGV